MFKIVRREEMSQGTVILNEIEAPLIAKKAKPGQFVILKANENGERIPLTMAETDTAKGTITIIYMVVGKSTALFKDLKVGEGYQDVIGPLGKIVAKGEQVAEFDTQYQQTRLDDERTDLEQSERGVRQLEVQLEVSRSQNQFALQQARAVDR